MENEEIKKLKELLIELIEHCRKSKLITGKFTMEPKYESLPSNLTFEALKDPDYFTYMNSKGYRYTEYVITIQARERNGNTESGN